eukprot:14908060-Alexandrium_andersonii.AAC.1
MEHPSSRRCARSEARACCQPGAKTPGTTPRGGGGPRASRRGASITESGGRLRPHGGCAYRAG